jgi:ABC-type transport system involved in Fe-S cluster assembly fused permease/ATPase subunit
MMIEVKGIAMIVIAHKMETMMNSDEIYILEADEAAERRMAKFPLLAVSPLLIQQIFINLIRF